jgi:hypothetical protein
MITAYQSGLQVPDRREALTPTSRSTDWVAREFDRRAATYDDSRHHIWQAQRAAELLDPQPGQLILDIATGTGLAARATAQRAGPTTTVVINYGFADPLRAASHDIREAIFETYAAAHRSADDAGEGDQILFSQCQLPEHRSSVPATNAYQPSRTPAAPTSASSEASTSGS